MSESKALKDFFAAWGEGDADRRADLLRASAAADFRYADPHAPEPITSVDGMIGFLGQFPPGANARLIGEPDIHHGHARANVAFDFGGGKSMVGQYFADLDDDGRILRIVGFPGKGAE